jgi:N-acetylated-alpha-linked acidic dipeptidase
MLLSGAWAQTDIRGFSPSQAKVEREHEDQARALPEPQRIRSYMERMSQEPHHAGSPASKLVAEYAAGLLREWGLDVRIEEFEALLPYPTVRMLEMVAPVKYRAKLQEPVVAEDKDSADKNQLPTYNAYSASGDVTAPLVYVNYGVPEDYEELKKLGIDVKGKIVIARYGKSWRGTKPKVAYEHGAVGCLIYSDPRDDGYFQGDVYPKGPFRPPAGAQRGSVMDMPVYVGDPLSPGWASERGAKKLPIAEATSIMKIPVLPISYEDAKPLLQNLEGPVAPEGWRGALPFTYHVGSGPASVHLKLDFDWATKPLYNVIATIPGSVNPDEWVIYGNHHDAWVNGAHDPLSGAAALLETARALGTMRKNGWTPKRSIKFALWDGEEFGLVGSTEWVEKHQEEINTKTVVYFNSDTNGKVPHHCRRL